jgi:uncharacterized membrane protein
MRSSNSALSRLSTENLLLTRLFRSQTPALTRHSTVALFILTRRIRRMEKGRLEAFSDGVLAIIITIMVLEMKVGMAHGAGFASLLPLLPVFLSYVLSFLYVAIYWNNHHHLIKAAHRVTAGIMWANMHLLFWLSLIPFATAWMGENHAAVAPSVLYGVVLLLSAIAYFILQGRILAGHGRGSALGAEFGRDVKGKLSLLLYAAAICVSFFKPWIAQVVYVAIALMWLIPDRRIERVLVGKP